MILIFFSGQHLEIMQSKIEKLCGIEFRAVLKLYVYFEKKYEKFMLT
jgi:hypothetical protein